MMGLSELTVTMVSANDIYDMYIMTNTLLEELLLALSTCQVTVSQLVLEAAVQQYDIQPSQSDIQMAICNA